MEEFAADPYATRVSRVLAAADRERRAVKRPPRKHAGKRLLMLAQRFPERVRQIGQVALRYAVATVATIDNNLDELVRSRYRQTAQTQRIQQLKDGGVGGDAQCERQDRGRRKSRTCRQHPEGVLQVLDDPLDDR
jgi:hypothetical protein